VREARSLGITGRVSNGWDGSVEVTAEGDADRLQRFLLWLRKGPPGAHVRDVEVSWTPPSGTYSTFDVEF
jgi:acylphosphatase